MNTKEVKAIIDKVFSSWDLFEKRLIKEKWFLSDIIHNANYRKISLNNEKFKQVYEKL
jgi:hypothetical protein